ncbi:MAG TPA: discoidin domain-containing protein [Verrucomicrobiae bacterium]|nr:discoidin domain-containing protein [Verrucomicrobiae bacterium]
MSGRIHRGVLLWVCGTLLSGRAAAAGPTRNLYSPHPQVTNLVEGISWPKGQALPTFAAPAPELDSIELQALTGDEQITFSALQGQVNRQQPRIYLLDARAGEGPDTWANTATVGLKSRKLFTSENKYDLLAKYAGEVRGLVLYDPMVSPHYRNLACTVAGVRRALPVTPAIRLRLQEHGIALPVLVDLTKLKYSSPLEIYQHLYQNYWAHCEKRLIVSARPTDLHHIRDIAAACGAAVVWLDNRIPAERDLMRKFFRDMHAGEAVALGWYTTERSGITTASEFGIGTMAADFYLNASVFSGTDHHIQIPKVPPMPELTNKVYVAIFISDGDNIQYVQHALRRIWDRSTSSRGKVPLNWTIAPGLVDIGPGLLNYYYTTATPNDCFVCGPSGMGYLMPCNTLNEPGAPVGVYTQDPKRMDGYTRLTETYLERSGLRVVTIWDNATPPQRASYADQCRSLYGATVQNFKDVPSVQGSLERDRIPFDKLVIPYATKYGHIRGSLADEIRSWDGNAPRFLAYQVSIWGEMKPARIVELQDDLDREFPGKVQFVRADHYFNLYNQATGRPFNLLLSPKTLLKGSSASAGLERVADGTPATLWTSSGTGTQWLEFDFGDVYEISRYVIRQAGANGLSRRLNTRDFVVQARAPGDAWTTLDKVKGNTSDVTDVDLEPVKARSVRILMTNPGADSTARISEVEIFGKKGR